MAPVPGQTSKRNTKSIPSAISSQQISGKNSESKNNTSNKPTHYILDHGDLRFKKINQIYLTAILDPQF